MIWFSRRRRRCRQEGAFETWVRLGNVANAAKKWPEAADHYSKALDLRPSEVAIRIQLGHALKEQNLLTQAELAYSRAVFDDPLDADAHLHLGHISKIQGKKAEAISAYRYAARLGNASAVGIDARRELLGLGVQVPVQIEIDVSELQQNGYIDLANAITACRWEKALVILAEVTSPPLLLKVAKAQVLQILQRFDEALAILTSEIAPVPGGRGSKALRALYIELGQREKAIQSLKSELQDSVKRGSPFDTQAVLIGELASMGELACAFDAGRALFISESEKGARTNRTAVSVKRERTTHLIPNKLSLELREDFFRRSVLLRDCGEHPQAVLLNDEALALASGSTGQ